MTKITRREFLKYSRALGLASILPGSSLLSLLELTGLTDFTTLDEKVLYNAKTKDFEGIKIIGDDNFFSKTTEALEYLKITDPPNYGLVKRNISKIRNHRRVFGISLRPRGIDVINGIVNVGDATANYSKEWYSSGMVHEAYHRELFRLGQPYKGESGERACILKQNEFLSKVGQPLDIEAELQSHYWERIFKDP